MFDRRFVRLSGENALQVHEMHPVTEVIAIKTVPGSTRPRVLPMGYSILMGILDRETARNNTYIYPLVGNPLLVYFCEPVDLFLQKRDEPRVATSVHGFEIYFEQPEPVVPARSTRSGREYA